MKDFSYVRAERLEQAVALLNEPGLRSCVLAGGTDLINQLRGSAAICDRAVDVAHIPELRVIETGRQIVIGAAVTHAEIVASPVLQAQVPLLVQACRQIGSPQIRNIATIGGNIINAAACADTLPVLVCLDADALVVTPAGETRLPVAELVNGVNRTALPASGLVHAFVFDPPPAGARSAFMRIGRRQAMSIARLSLAALALQDQAGVVSQLRLAPGAALARVRRVSAAEALLLGRVPTPELIAAVAAAMSEQFRAESGHRWSAPYKERVIAVLTERALHEVLKI